jgi:hypothetical protein
MGPSITLLLKGISQVYQSFLNLYDHIMQQISVIPTTSKLYPVKRSIFV